MVGIFSAERTMQAATAVENSAGQQDCIDSVVELEMALNELQAAINAKRFEVD
jgi:hypothetical protein